jgi:AraC-like DNA-binding protein
MLHPRWGRIKKKKKMLFDRLSASPALRTLNITDLEQYRVTERFVDSESIPLRITSFSVSRAVLTLPHCTVMLAQSFPRLLDAVYRRANPLVVLMAEKPNGLIHNGIPVNSCSIAFAQGRSDYRVHEEASNWYFSAMFTRSVDERGWPEVIDRFALFNASCQSMNALRSTLADMFMSASAFGQGELTNTVLASMEDSLLHALDRAFRSDVQLVDQRLSATSLRLVREIDARLERDPSATIYSSALATELGVSVRTLHSATVSIRGMSLHRYLKTKRLWLVYRRLLSAAPGARVKSIALQHGFWHMGEFSADYQRLFGELPSKTLALAQLRAM